MPGLYIHIPFCVRKCIYCDFYSLETMGGPIAARLTKKPDDQSAFLDALETELHRAPADFRPETVFIGGGTPTELSVTDIGRLMKMIHRHIDVNAVTEWTCESNPGTLAREKMEILRGAGVNRVSLGVQSFNERNLEFLGRIHSPGDVETGYRLLRDIGIENINLDLIYGIPGSAPETVGSDVERLIELGPEHVSCYCLTFEPGTPLHRMRDRGWVHEVDDEEELAQYGIIRRRLKEAGYDQYEISNFARPDRICRHNLLYWGDGEYLGFGPSAHSHWKGARWGNVRHLRKYVQGLRRGDDVRAFAEKLEPEAKARETLVMALRRMEGVSRGEFARRTGYDYRALCGEQIDAFAESGWLSEQSDRLALTEAGLFVSDRIFSEMI